MHIVVIGLGGVGSILSERLCRFLHYSKDINDVSMTFVDGDEYETKNFERQEFMRMGKKAEVKSIELMNKYRNINFKYKNVFIDATNISTILSENDIIFLGVDNHKTRKIVSDYCQKLQDVTLISGGNELTDGNVQIYVRRGGKDLTPDLCKYHPEIKNPDDKLPNEMSCEELSNSEPQLYFTNLGVATLMCWAFYNAIVKGDFSKSEVYFDILTMTADSKVRKVTN